MKIVLKFVPYNFVENIEEFCSSPRAKLLACYILYYFESTYAKLKS